MNRRSKTALLATLAALFAVAVIAAPPSATRETLFYSGVASGVSGTAAITIEIVNSTNQVRCTTVSSTTPLDAAGAFRIALDDTCNAAITPDEDLKIRLNVNGNVLTPDQPLGLVPDAVRARQASGVLALQLASLEARLEAIETSSPPLLIADANPSGSIDVGGGVRSFTEQVSGSSGYVVNSTFIAAGATPAHFDLSGNISTRGKVRFGPIDLPPRGFSIEILFELLAQPSANLAVGIAGGLDQIRLDVNNGNFALTEGVGQATSSTAVTTGVHHVVIVHEDDDTLSFYDLGTRLIDHASIVGRSGYPGVNNRFSFEPFESGADIRFFRMRIHGTALNAAEVDSKCNELRTGFGSPYVCN